MLGQGADIGLRNRWHQNHGRQTPDLVPLTSGAGSWGRFDRADFAYEADKDVYICPAGEHLSYRYASELDNKMQRSYCTSLCSGCVIKDRCTSAKDAVFDAGNTKTFSNHAQTHRR